MIQHSTLQKARKWLASLVGATAFSLSIFAPHSALAAEPIKLEAENATLNGVGVATAYPGYSGSGYAWTFEEETDNIVFSFAAQAGQYDLVIQYTSPFDAKGYGLIVNGTSSSGMFAKTGGSFSSASIGRFTLREGQNSVTITKGWGYYGIDYIAMVPVTQEPPKLVTLVDGRAEAEDAVLSGLTVGTSPAGFSGKGYATGYDNATDKTTFNFNAPAGLYKLTLGYTSPFGEKGYDLQVNDEKSTGIFAGTGATFSSVPAGTYFLTEGLNTIVVGNGWGYFGLDYVQLTPTTAPLPAKTPKTLTDAQATSATRSLFAYMTDLYGTKMLSGQQELRELDYIQAQTGKEAAIGSFDLMDYSPSRVARGTKPEGSSESYIAWAKKDDGRGIVSLSWHWNAPTDLIDLAPDKLWWSGFYTRATTFDLAAALADKNSERYQLLIRDIDVIAVELKKFQAAGLPVLWRPLHEAPGGWFWWGAKGPEAFKELWRIMHERMTNHHQLHNLIWSYTGTDDIRWYPGDAYVDLVGLDIYSTPLANLSGDWGAMQALFGGKKMVALTESGNFPVPDKVRAFATWWSYFSLWNGDYIRKQPLDLLRTVFNDRDVITRDELPNWYAYGAPTVTLANTGPLYACAPAVLQAQIEGSASGVSAVRFLANGELIGTDTQGQDGWQLSWTAPTTGTYTLTAEATNADGITGGSAPVAVTVKADNQQPVLTVSAEKKVLWIPNHAYYTMRVQDFVTSATDNCDGNLDMAAVRITQVTSDEAEDAPGSGNTRQDIVINSDCQSVQLRSERAGRGDGRVYTIRVAVADKAGNTTTAEYQVVVPVSLRQPAVAGAVAYTQVSSNCGTGTPPVAGGKSIFERLTDYLTVYPNPASGDFLTVNVQAAQRQEAIFTLFDSRGQAVMTTTKTLEAGTNQVPVSLEKTTTGVYLLIVTKDKQRMVKRVVVVK